MRVYPQWGRSVTDQYTGRPCIAINDWTARELNADLEDNVTLEYYVWQEGGRLETEEKLICRLRDSSHRGLGGGSRARAFLSRHHRVGEHVRLGPAVSDRSRTRAQAGRRLLAPISHHAESLHSAQRGPKTLADALRWSDVDPCSGKQCVDPRSIRWGPTDARSGKFILRQHLRERLSPLQMGFQVIPVREQGLQASRGATDFGEYFLYFSFFLVVSALLLTALFFKLGIEQRLREIGTLQASASRRPEFSGFFSRKACCSQLSAVCSACSARLATRSC